MSEILSNLTHTSEETVPTGFISSKDISSKTIFHDPLLCCQFLHNNINLPLLKHIRPEDIEDYTERFNSYFGTEYAADTIKKIHIKPSSDNPLSEELEFF